MKTKVLLSVERTFDVLQVLRQTPNLSVGRIAAKIGIGKTSAYRILVALVENGAVVKTSDGYQLGIVMFDLGKHVDLAEAIGPTCSQVLQSLSERYGENTHAAVFEQGMVKSIGYYPSYHSPSNDRWIGQKKYPHQGSSGKVLLASLPQFQVDEYMKSSLLPKTQFTITDKKVLLEELKRISELGYSVSHQEHQLGMSSVAVPVYDLDQYCIASIGISARSARMNDIFLKQTIDDLRKASVEITQKLFNIEEKELSSPSAIQQPKILGA